MNLQERMREIERQKQREALAAAQKKQRAITEFEQKREAAFELPRKLRFAELLREVKRDAWGGMGEIESSSQETRLTFEYEEILGEREEVVEKPQEKRHFGLHDVYISGPTLGSGESGTYTSWSRTVKSFGFYTRLEGGRSIHLYDIGKRGTGLELSVGVVFANSEERENGRAGFRLSVKGVTYSINSDDGTRTWFPDWPYDHPKGQIASGRWAEYWIKDPRQVDLPEARRFLEDAVAEDCIARKNNRWLPRDIQQRVQGELGHIPLSQRRYI